MLRQALCVCKCFSRVSWRSASCPGVTCVGENAGLFSDACACAFGGLSANQRRRNKILPSCAVDKSRSRSPMQTSAPADRRRTTPKTTKSRRRTRQPSVSNMNSNGSERRRTLEAPELLRSRDPPPGSILAALRRTESSLTHGAATPVHCRGMTSRQWDQHTANWRW